MIDHTPQYDLPWTFKGHGWVFLLPPVSSSSPASIRHFVGSSGQLVGGSGALTLYRYSHSPFGPYDELSYSPGCYEYLSAHNPRNSGTARRVTKNYVSCSENDVHIIRSKCGIPAEKAQFIWQETGAGEVVVTIALPNGEHVVELSLKRAWFPAFTINSSSIVSNAIDLARFAPIVQPLLDGNQVPVPSSLSQYSPLLQSAPLLKFYTSIRGTSRLATLARAVTNADNFPPIEETGVSRYGLAMEEVEMTMSVPEIVLEVDQVGESGTSGIYETISNWVRGLLFMTPAQSRPVQR